MAAAGLPPPVSTLGAEELVSEADQQLLLDFFRVLNSDWTLQESEEANNFKVALMPTLTLDSHCGPRFTLYCCVSPQRPARGPAGAGFGTDRHAELLLILLLLFFYV